MGLPLGALSLTVRSDLLGEVARVSLVLDHVWRVVLRELRRAARSASACVIMVWLWNRGDYKGVLNTNHFHSIGQLMLAFTVFWAYVTFSQYFLIWNANVPEETFWYNLRELNHDGSTNQWWYVGLCDSVRPLLRAVLRAAVVSFQGHEAYHPAHRATGI